MSLTDSMDTSGENGTVSHVSLAQDILLGPTVKDTCAQELRDLDSNDFFSNGTVTASDTTSATVVNIGAEELQENTNCQYLLGSRNIFDASKKTVPPSEEDAKNVSGNIDMLNQGLSVTKDPENHVSLSVGLANSSLEKKPHERDLSAEFLQIYMSNHVRDNISNHLLITEQKSESNGSSANDVLVLEPQESEKKESSLFQSQKKTSSWDLSTPAVQSSTSIQNIMFDASISASKTEIVLEGESSDAAEGLVNQTIFMGKGVPVKKGSSNTSNIFGLLLEPDSTTALPDDSAFHDPEKVCIPSSGTNSTVINSDNQIVLTASSVSDGKESQVMVFDPEMPQRCVENDLLASAELSMLISEESLNTDGNTTASHRNLTVEHKCQSEAVCGEKEVQTSEECQVVLDQCTDKHKITQLACPETSESTHPLHSSADDKVMKTVVDNLLQSVYSAVAKELNFCLEDCELEIQKVGIDKNVETQEEMKMVIDDLLKSVYIAAAEELNLCVRSHDLHIEEVDENGSEQTVMLIHAKNRSPSSVGEELKSCGLTIADCCNDVSSIVHGVLYTGEQDSDDSMKETAPSCMDGAKNIDPTIAVDETQAVPSGASPLDEQGLTAMICDASKQDKSSVNKIHSNQFEAESGNGCTYPSTVEKSTVIKCDKTSEELLFNFELTGQPQISSCITGNEISETGKVMMPEGFRVDESPKQDLTGVSVENSCRSNNSLEHSTVGSGNNAVYNVQTEIFNGLKSDREDQRWTEIIVEPDAELSTKKSVHRMVEESRSCGRDVLGFPDREHNGSAMSFAELTTAHEENMDKAVEESQMQCEEDSLGQFGDKTNDSIKGTLGASTEPYAVAQKKNLSPCYFTSQKLRDSMINDVEILDAQCETVNLEVPHFENEKDVCDTSLLPSDCDDEVTEKLSGLHFENLSTSNSSAAIPDAVLDPVSSLDQNSEVGKCVKMDASKPLEPDPIKSRFIDLPQRDGLNETAGIWMELQFAVCQSQGSSECSSLDGEYVLDNGSFDESLNSDNEGSVDLESLNSDHEGSVDPEQFSPNTLELMAPVVAPQENILGIAEKNGCYSDAKNDTNLLQPTTLKREESPAQYMPSYEADSETHSGRSEVLISEEKASNLQSNSDTAGPLDLLPPKIAVSCQESPLKMRNSSDESQDNQQHTMYDCNTNTSNINDSCANVQEDGIPNSNLSSTQQGNCQTGDVYGQKGVTIVSNLHRDPIPAAVESVSHTELGLVPHTVQIDLTPAMSVKTSGAISDDFGSIVQIKTMPDTAVDGPLPSLETKREQIDVNKESSDFNDATSPIVHYVSLSDNNQNKTSDDKSRTELIIDSVSFKAAQSGGSGSFINNDKPGGNVDSSDSRTNYSQVHDQYAAETVECEGGGGKELKAKDMTMNYKKELDAVNLNEESVIESDADVKAALNGTDANAANISAREMPPSYNECFHVERKSNGVVDAIALNWPVGCEELAKSGSKVNNVAYEAATPTPCEEITSIECTDVVNTAVSHLPPAKEVAVGEVISTEEKKKCLTANEGIDIKHEISCDTKELSEARNSLVDEREKTSGSKTSVGNDAISYAETLVESTSESMNLDSCEISSPVMEFDEDDFFTHSSRVPEASITSGFIKQTSAAGLLNSYRGSSSSYKSWTSYSSTVPTSVFIGNDIFSDSDDGSMHENATSSSGEDESYPTTEENAFEDSFATDPVLTIVPSPRQPSDIDYLPAAGSALAWSGAEASDFTYQCFDSGWEELAKQKYPYTTSLSVIVEEPEQSDIESEELVPGYHEKFTQRTEVEVLGADETKELEDETSETPKRGILELNEHEKGETESEELIPAHHEASTQKFEVKMVGADEMKKEEDETSEILKHGILEQNERDKVVTKYEELTPAHHEEATQRFEVEVLGADEMEKLEDDTSETRKHGVLENNERDKVETESEELTPAHHEESTQRLEVEVLETDEMKKEEDDTFGIPKRSVLELDEREKVETKTAIEEQKQLAVNPRENQNEGDTMLGNEEFYSERSVGQNTGLSLDSYLQNRKLPTSTIEDTVLPAVPPTSNGMIDTAEELVEAAPVVAENSNEPPPIPKRKQKKQVITATENEISPTMVVNQVQESDQTNDVLCLTAQSLKDKDVEQLNSSNPDSSLYNSASGPLKSDDLSQSSSLPKYISHAVDKPPGEISLVDSVAQPPVNESFVSEENHSQSHDENRATVASNSENMAAPMHMVAFSLSSDDQVLTSKPAAIEESENTSQVTKAAQFELLCNDTTLSFVNNAKRSSIEHEENLLSGLYTTNKSIEESGDICHVDKAVESRKDLPLSPAPLAVSALDIHTRPVAKFDDAIAFGQIEAVNLPDLSAGDQNTPLEAHERAMIVTTQKAVNGVGLTVTESENKTTEHVCNDDSSTLTNNSINRSLLGETSNQSNFDEIYRLDDALPKEPPETNDDDSACQHEDCEKKQDERGIPALVIPDSGSSGPDETYVGLCIENSYEVIALSVIDHLLEEVLRADQEHQTIESIQADDDESFEEALPASAGCHSDDAAKDSQNVLEDEDVELSSSQLPEEKFEETQCINRGEHPGTMVESKNASDDTRPLNQESVVDGDCRSPQDSISHESKRKIYTASADSIGSISNAEHFEDEKDEIILKKTPTSQGQRLSSDMTDLKSSAVDSTEGPFGSRRSRLPELPSTRAKSREPPPSEPLIIRTRLELVAKEDIIPIVPKPELRRLVRWEHVMVKNIEYRIDDAIIQPFKRVVAHGGFYDQKSAIIEIFTSYLPSSNTEHYAWVMDNLFLYVLATVELLAQEKFSIVMFVGSTPKNQIPANSLLRKWHEHVNYRLKKNVEAFYIVNPTFYFRTMARIFVSRKVMKKMKYVKSLAELKAFIPTDFLFVPPEIAK